MKDIDFSRVPPDVLKAWEQTGDNTLLQPYVPQGSVGPELGGKASTVLNVGGLEEPIQTFKNFAGKGAFVSPVDVRKVDPTYQGPPIPEQQFRSKYSSDRKIEDYRPELHNQENLRDYFSSYAKGAVDVANTANENFAGKDQKALNLALNPAKIASDTNEVYQAFMKEYPHLGGQKVKDYLVEGIDNYVAAKNDYLNGKSQNDPQSAAPFMRELLITAEYNVPQSLIANTKPIEISYLADSIDDKIADANIGVGTPEFRREKKETWDELKAGWSAVLSTKSQREFWYGIAGVNKNGEPDKNYLGVDPFVLYSQASLGGANKDIALDHNNQKLNRKKIEAIANNDT